MQNAVNGITRNVLKFQKMCESNQIANGFAKTAAVPLSSFLIFNFFILLTILSSIIIMTITLLLSLTTVINYLLSQLFSRVCTCITIISFAYA